MSFAPHRQHLSIDSATVILNQNPQAVCFICDFHFDPLCVRVPKRVDYSFSANVVDFVANERMQWPVPAFNDHAKMDLLVKGVFLLDPRECPFQIHLSMFGRAKASESISALFHDLPHEFEDA